MSERLNSAEAFVAAVETGNFALAAQRLGLSRSAVGKSVAKLEGRLGTRLFQRTTRSQSLTEAGQAYYEHCRRALSELDAADAVVAAGQQVPRGTLRVTMPVLLGRACVAPLLLALGREHSELRFSLAFSDQVVDLVEERMDLGIRSGPLGDSAVLAARPLGAQWMGVYASPGYLARHGRPADLDDMAARRDAHSFVGYARGSEPHPWEFRDAQGRIRAFDTSLRTVFSSNSIEVNLTAAIDGMGISRLPAWLAADAVAAGTLVRLFDEPRPYGYALHAVWPQARALPLKTRVAIDRLAERLPALLAPEQPDRAEAGR
jgi:DNA-binding transcriptional LysR family regulator